MIKNDLYKESFKTLVLKSVESNTYIGTGNPNSKVLIVGKEGSCDVREEEICFANQWLQKIDNNEYVDFNEPNKLTEGHTWNKYQKLHDYIFEEPKLYQKKENFDFQEKFFTTEMNKNRAKRTKDALKDGMLERKNTFFREDFIKQFPVIILACGDYIQNKEIREIDDIFGVEFVREYKTETLKPQSFWTHYNPEKTKLVIHTRQLSSNVTNELLIEMAKVIKKHLKI